MATDTSDAPIAPLRIQGGIEDIMQHSSSGVLEEDWEEVMMEHGLTDVGSKEQYVTTWVDSNIFETVMVFLIFTNTVFIAISLDMNTEGTDQLPFQIAENIFCGIWFIEFSLKLGVKRCSLFYSAWNILDFFLAALSVFDTWIMPLMFGGVDASMKQFTVFRTLRMLKLLKLIRVVRVLKMFKELWLVVSGFIESFATLNWVIMLMAMIIYIFAIVLRFEVRCDEPGFLEWDSCDRLFGTVPRTMYTLFQVSTLESWSEVIARPVIFAKPWLVIVFLAFLCLTSFGIMNVMVGVIVENVQAAQSQNEKLQERRHQGEVLAEVEKLRVIFEAADVDGSGKVDRDEFVSIVRQENVQRILHRMEVPTDDPEVLFDMMEDDDSGQLRVSSFIGGILKMKGPPTLLDQKAMGVLIKGLSRRFYVIEKILLGGSRDDPTLSRATSGFRPTFPTGLPNDTREAKLVEHDAEMPMHERGGEFFSIPGNTKQHQHGSMPRAQAVGSVSGPVNIAMSGATLQTPGGLGSITNIRQVHATNVLTESFCKEHEAVEHGDATSSSQGRHATDQNMVLDSLRDIFSKLARSIEIEHLHELREKDVKFVLEQSVSKHNEQMESYSNVLLETSSDSFGSGSGVTAEDPLVHRSKRVRPAQDRERKKEGPLIESPSVVNKAPAHLQAIEAPDASIDSVPSISVNDTDGHR